MAENSKLSRVGTLGFALGALSSLPIMWLASNAFLQGYIAYKAAHPVEYDMGWDALFFIIVGIMVLPVWFAVAGLAGLLESRFIARKYQEYLKVGDAVNAQSRTIWIILAVSAALGFLALIFPGCAAGISDSAASQPFMFGYAAPVTAIGSFLVFALNGFIALWYVKIRLPNNLIGNRAEPDSAKA